MARAVVVGPNGLDDMEDILRRGNCRRALVLIAVVSDVVAVDVGGVDVVVVMVLRYTSCQVSSRVGLDNGR